MINAGIFDGDNILVEKCDNVHNGDIVVALIDDSATVKRFYKEDGHISLPFLEISHNKKDCKMRFLKLQSFFVLNI